VRTYLIRRLLLFIPVLLLVYTFVFVLIRIVPGDIVNLMMEGAGGRGTSVATEAELRHELGIDKSIPQQYAIQLQHLLRGDLGRSFRNGRPVTIEIGRRLPITLELASLAILIALSTALVIGSVAALRHDSGADRAISVLSIIALSVPAFWTGTLIVVLPARLWGYSPPFSFSSILDDPGQNLQQMLPAAITLGAIFAGVLTRYVRSSLLEVLRQDYIRTAWAKGLRERIVLMNHGLRNAFIPVITVVGLQVSGLLGGAVITERVFNLPGMGTLTITAINQRDYPQLEANVLVLAFIVLVVNLFVDVAYGWLDPRIRVG
jgi:peptide/nickel transport system permease protein